MMDILKPLGLASIIAVSSLPAHSQSVDGYFSATGSVGACVQDYCTMFIPIPVETDSLLSSVSCRITTPWGGRFDRIALDATGSRMFLLPRKAPASIPGSEEYTANVSGVHLKMDGGHDVKIVLLSVGAAEGSCTVNGRAL